MYTFHQTVISPKETVAILCTYQMYCIASYIGTLRNIIMFIHFLHMKPGKPKTLTLSGVNA